MHRFIFRIIVDDRAILQGKELDTLSGLIRSSLSLSMKSRFSHHYHHQNHHSHAIADGWIETFPKGPLLGIHAILRRNWVHRWSCMRCCSIMRWNWRGISRSWRSTMRFGLWSQWRSRRHCLFLRRAAKNVWLQALWTLIDHPWRMQTARRPISNDILSCNETIKLRCCLRSLEKNLPHLLSNGAIK